MTNMRNFRNLINNFVVKVTEKFGYNISIRKIDQNPFFSEIMYADYPEDSKKQKKFYNIGAGSFYHKYWTNFDYSSNMYASLQKKGYIEYDIMSKKSLPLKNNDAELIYVSHVIEHVTDEVVDHLFIECFRVLKSSGIIRIITPDLDFLYTLYAENENIVDLWRDRYNPLLFSRSFCEKDIHQLFLQNFATQLSELSIDPTSRYKYSDKEFIKLLLEYPYPEFLNYFSQRCSFNPESPANHMNWYNYNKLVSKLKKAGFSNIYRSAYAQSRAPPMRDVNFFDQSSPWLSLYVEAKK